MPIVKSSSGKGFGGALAYALQEDKELSEGEKVKIIAANGIDGSRQDMARQMHEVVKMGDNDRLEKPVFHLIVSFSPEESKKLEEATKEKAVNEIMKGINIDDNRQYLVVEHNDREHSHYHIITNKIDFDGQSIDQSNINFRATAQADKVEREMNLERTPNRNILYEDNEQGFRYATKEEKQQNRAEITKQAHDKREAVEVVKTDIRDKVDNTLKSERLNPQQFKETMLKQGIDVDFKTNKNGIYGVSFQSKDVAVKGSEIGYKWGELSKKLDLSQEHEQTQSPKEEKADLSFSERLAVIQQAAKEQESPFKQREQDNDKEQSQGWGFGM